MNRQLGYSVPLALSLLCWMVILTALGYAQTPSPVTPGYQVCVTTDPGNTRCSFQPTDLTHGLPVNLVAGSVTASLAPFTPLAAGSRMTPLAVTTADSTGTLPVGAQAVVVTNVGTNPMYCNVAGVAATTSDQYISASGGWFVFAPGAVTSLHCIATGGSTTANGIGGTGLPAGTGGGSGGAGGSSAITTWGGATLGAATAWGSAPTGNVNGVNSNVLVSVLPTGAATSANQATIITNTTGIATAANQSTSQTSLTAIAASTASIDTKASAPLPAQSVRTVNIGEVDVDFSRMASAPISVSTITTTQLVALSGSTKVYVTAYDVVAGGTGNITFVYGTGSSCGTGTTSLTGAYNLTAQAGIAKGSGIAPVLVVPAGNALCVTTSAAVQMSGSVSYQQF